MNVIKPKLKYYAVYNAVLKFIESDDDEIVFTYETPYNARLVNSRLYSWAKKRKLNIEVHFRNKTNVVVKKMKGA